MQFAVSLIWWDTETVGTLTLIELILPAFSTKLY